MDYCPKCGFAFRDHPELRDDPDLHFCPRCGKDLAALQSRPGNDENLHGQIVECLKNLEYVRAVRLAVEKTGKPLRDAKMLVHAVAAQNGIKITIPWRKWLVAAVIFSLFFGLVVSAVGIGVYPRMGLVAAPFLCGGELDYRSHEITTPPGTAGDTKGTARSFHCPDGTNQSMAVYALCTIIYAAAIFIVLIIRRIIKNVDVPGATSGPLTPPHS